MAVFEMESWLVKDGKDKEHAKAMRQWFKWVGEHRELFKEWKSVRYFEKTVAGEESGRHLILWEYESLPTLKPTRNVVQIIKGHTLSTRKMILTIRVYSSTVE